ncbi:MAG: T9SS type A sorting domain-containing protein [Bacteroidia bacterium]|jgi:hypothetical protein
MKTTNQTGKFISLLFVVFLAHTQILIAQISGTKSIGSGGTYTTLTAAITAATSAGMGGPLLLELQSNYTGAGESYPITVSTIAGLSATNTITIRPQTGASGLSITSANTTATFAFNSTSYVIIDGRPGGTGGFTAGTNLVVSNSAGTAPAILFSGDNRGNQVNYCDVQSGNSTIMTATAGAGVICYGSTTGSFGSDSNSITYSNIHGYGGVLPVIGVFSYGSTTSLAHYNDSNILDQCNIYDFNTAGNSCGIYASVGNNAWRITNNHLYQTAELVYTGAAIQYGIYITSGSGYTIDNNFLGGNNRLGTGMYSVNLSGTTATNTFYGINYATALQTQTTSIRSNTISRIDYTSAANGSGVMVLLQIYGGNVECHDNIIGSPTVNGSIKFTTTNAVSAGVGGMIALRVGTGSNIVNLTGNIISGIDMYAAQPAYSPEFHGINLTTSTSTAVITATNNTVGSKTLANSINIVSSCSTSTAASRLNAFIINNTQPLISITVSNNIVANLNTNYSASGTQAASTRAIWFNPQAAGLFTISNNQVFNISTATQTTGTGVNSALIGIAVSTTTGTVHISNNSVQSLKLTGTSTNASVTCSGIFYNGISTVSNSIDRNFIRHLTMSAANPATIIQGMELNAGLLNVNNNMISLGYDTAGNSITVPCAIKGIIKNSAAVSLYFNTVYLGGSGVSSTSAASTMALQRFSAGTDDFRNNIIINNRSNASTGGTHYQVYLNASTGLVVNNNNYNGNGSGAVFGFDGTSDVTAYSSGWISGDNASYTTTPALIAPAGNYQNCNLHISIPGNKGVSISGVSIDLDGDLRNTPPDIGADEIPYDLSILSIDSPSSSNFCSQVKPVFITLKNTGTLLITSATIRYFANGVLSGTFNWSGNLVGGATSSPVNIGNYNFTGGIKVISAICSAPNGKLDNNAANDTARFTYTITQTVVPNITVSTPLTSVCTNSQVVFKASFLNGGDSPVFTWKLNGSLVGNNDSVLNISTLASGDSVWAEMTSNAACANPANAVSNKVKMTVSSSLIPSISVVASKDTVCPGQQVIYTTSIINGGIAPQYRWMKNGIQAGTDSVAYVLNPPANQDAITCILTSSLSCASPGKDTSDVKVLTVLNAPVPLALISASSTTICNGVLDTFTVTTSNGGSNPAYNWRKNTNTSFGVGNDTLVTNILQDGDSVYVILTSNAPCANPVTVTSNKIAIKVLPIINASATISVSSNAICTGETLKVNASFTNQGSLPVFEWYKNGVLLPNTTDSLLISQLNNQDTIYMMLTSNAPCVSQPKVTSNKQIITVNPIVTPDVTMSTTSNNICAGTIVHFSAQPVNGGSTPHFVWYRNGQSAGTDSSGFTTTLINHADSFSVVLITSAPCATKSTDTSSAITMTVNPTVTPTIGIQTSSITFCPGAMVSFNANVTNAGTSPHFQWYRNSLAVGGDSASFSTNTLSDKDTISVVFTSSLSCVTANNIRSNKLVMLMLPAINSSVTILADKDSICSGTAITFTAQPINGGTTPIYQWRVNGVNTGLQGLQFSTDLLKHSDTVQVTMASSASCAVPVAAFSNSIVMHVNPAVEPNLIITSVPQTICTGEYVRFTANDSNGGTSPVHKWFLNNTLSGSDSLSFTTKVQNGDIIKCVLKSSISCVTKMYDTAFASVTIKSNPVKPIITRSRDTLTSTIAATYQWSRNNADINGATNRMLVFSENGVYRVTVDSIGCKTQSDGFTVNNVGIRELLQTQHIELWPNPTNEWLFVKAGFESLEEIEISIFDLSGREVWKQNLSPESAIDPIQLNISKLDYGWYILQLKQGEWMQRSKVMKGE